MKKLLILIALFSCSDEEIINKVLIKVSCTAGCDIRHSGEDGQVESEIKAVCTTTKGSLGETIKKCNPTSAYSYTLIAGPQKRVVVRAKNKPDYIGNKKIEIFVNGEILAWSDEFIEELVVSAIVP